MVAVPEPIRHNAPRLDYDSMFREMNAPTLNLPEPVAPDAPVVQVRQASAPLKKDKRVKKGTSLFKYFNIE